MEPSSPPSAGNESQHRWPKCRYRGTRGCRGLWVSPGTRGHGTGTLTGARSHGISPYLIAPDCCVGADGSLLTPLQLAELLSWKQHTSKKMGKSAGRAPKQRGAIRALENVTCDERWKRHGPFKPGEGKGEDVITVLKYVEGNCKRERNKVFPE